jgi:radical SAM superfamily enzyme YgiQ (UPF0313 family)
MLVAFVFQGHIHARAGIMHLASVLKAQHHDVCFADAGRMGMDRLGELVAERKPAIIGYSAMTGEHVGLLEVNRALKQKFSFLALFGGPHATFAAADLIEEPGCDAVCIGEGDIAVPEFCRRLEAGEEWWKSPNFVARREGNVYRNDLLPLVEDLDALPMPDHDLMYGADPQLAREGAKFFYTSRGCPYTCSYCSHVAYNELYRGKGPIVRHESPEKVIEEICYVKAHYPLTHVVINDDAFLLKPKGWFEAFCAGYKARVGVPFACMVRPNLVTPELIALLKDAGLVVAAMGVECGNDDVARDILKRNITCEQLLRASRILQENGVRLATLNICGLPVPESYALDLQTLDLNIELAPTFALTSILYPYPNTVIRDYAIEHGFLAEGAVPVLETNKRSSMLTFRSPLDKRRIENLAKLFDLMVHFPWLRRRADFLCSLPLGALYTAIFYLRYGYIWKFRMFPFTSFTREIGAYVLLFLRTLRQS